MCLVLRAKTLLVYSRTDPASSNIASHVLELLGKTEELTVGGYRVLYSDELNLALLELKDELIYADYVEELVEAELAIFLSRHEAAARRPSLTVHVPGNWTEEARHGGRPQSFCIAPAYPMLVALNVLWTERADYGLEDWLCSYEATHHGPYLEKLPAFFVEIGSTETEWRNERAGELVAVSALESADKRGCEAFLGLGGPHYAPKLTSYALEKEAPLGHIAPRYVLDSISPSILLKAAGRTLEPVTGVVVDWKGTKKRQRENLLPPLAERGVRIIRA